MKNTVCKVSSFSVSGMLACIFTCDLLLDMGFQGGQNPMNPMSGMPGYRPGPGGAPMPPRHGMPPAGNMNRPAMGPGPGGFRNVSCVELKV